MIQTFYIALIFPDIHLTIEGIYYFHSEIVIIMMSQVDRVWWGRGISSPHIPAENLLFWTKYMLLSDTHALQFQAIVQQPLTPSPSNWK